jgi:hypothetical protein
MITEVHRDDSAQCTGTHAGATSATLFKPGADFKSCGVTVGVAIYNDTDGSNGLVTAVTEDTVSCTLAGGTGNVWDYGDTYSIYLTSTYNSVISRITVDKRAGHKVTDPNQLTMGVLPEDLDLDEKNEKVFGRGQPVKVMGE